MNIISRTNIGRKIKRLCGYDRPVSAPSVLTSLLTPEVNAVTLFEACSGVDWKYTLRLLFGNLKAFCLIMQKHSWSFLPFPNMGNLCHGFSAGKQVVASYLHCINCRLNSNLTANPIPLSLCVSYCHVTTLTSHVELLSHEEK